MTQYLCTPRQELMRGSKAKTTVGSDSAANVGDTTKLAVLLGNGTGRCGLSRICGAW